MWYEKNYRRVFMDMHLSDARPEEYLSKLDVADFVKTMRDAHVTNVVVKAKSHVGLHYWPCKHGRMHESLRRRGLDYVGEMIRECHQNDIAVIVYYSQIYDNYAYDEHPAWRIVYDDGKTSREDGKRYAIACPNEAASRYGLVCPNNLEYRAYAKEILTELVETYDFEGLFMDMPFWPGICHCDACRARFLQESGQEIPQQEDWSNPVWVQFAHARQAWINEFAAFTTAVVKGIKPNISIEHNASAVAASWALGNNEALLQQSDYAGGDYYGGYLEQTFLCKYYNNVTRSKPFSYITSRCDSNLYSHTVSRCSEDLLLHAMNALVHNGAFSMCDAMNPDGTLTKEVYKTTVGPVYAQTALYEQYVSGDLLCDVAVWFNTNMKANANFIKSPLNVVEILKEYNLAYDVVGSKNLKALQAQVLCVNDVYEITDEEVADLAGYLARGGKLFLTGRLSNPRLQALLGIAVTGESEYDYTYLSPVESPDSTASALFETFSTASPYPVASKAYEAELTGEAEILATLTYPYTKRGSREFSAIHTDPPGLRTALPAVVRKKIGAGTVLWAAAPMELTRAHYCRKAVAALVQSLLTTRQFTSNAPDFVEIVGWKKDGKRYFSILNQQAKSPVYPLQGIVLALPYACKTVRLLTPSEGRLTVENGADATQIMLPKLSVFHIIEVETART
ncbi:MAG: alpha-L-fucosidase [Ruthenibacterium sp.]